MDLQEIKVKLLLSLQRMNSKNTGIYDPENADDTSIFGSGNDSSLDGINGLLADDTFIRTYDSNNDGTIDEREINAFIQDIENNNVSPELDISQLAQEPNEALMDTPEVSQASDAAPAEMTPDAQINGENSQAEVGQILDKIYSNETAQALIDIDGDGVLSDQEKGIFEKYVQGDKTELTAEDLENVLSEIENGTYEYVPEGEEIPDEDKIDLKNTEIEDPEMQKAAEAERAHSAASGGGSYSNYNGNSNTNNENAVKSVENMSLEELEAEKSERESNLAEAQDNLNAVHNGTNEAVANAQKTYEEAQEAYEKELENDKNVSDDLKERQSENLDNINTTQGEIDNLNVEINDKNSQKSDTETAIRADESNISALEAALANLNNYNAEDEEKKQEVASKKQSVLSQLEAARAQKAEHEQQLETIEKDLGDLEDALSDKNDELDAYEQERQEIENEILANCGEETKAALEAFNTAKSDLEAEKTTQLSTAESELTKAQTALQEVNDAINVKQAKKTERENSVNDLENFEKLYETMGLEEQGLNFEVFSLAMEGYLNLEDKGNGYLGIFDTTQPDDAERYYLLDMNEFELLERSQLKTGSGDMTNIQHANKGGSHATLSGFEKIGQEYYSNSMGKKALRIIGLEQGINDNALSKGTVVHYTTGNHTWGCKGFPPVYKNGSIDMNATYQRMYDLFPENTIIFTCPTYADQYRQLSSLYA